MNSNLVLVNLFLEEGCSQEEGEVSIFWKPINFMIYSELFSELIYEGISEYLESHKISFDRRVELIMCHVVERDAGGAVHTEYFEPIHSSNILL